MENPRKRVKTEHEESHARLEIQSPDLWIDDGNLILRARAEGPETDEPAYTLFRVHKGLLGTQAGYFRRLSLGGISERMDNIPVLELPESASDVDDFLRALYLPNHLSSFPAMSDSNQAVNRSNFPAVLAGMLRMCKNYDAPALGDIVKAKIRNEWPMTLEKWDSLQNAISRYPDAQRAHGFADPVATIRLAREYNIPEVLPAAFYDLSRVYAFDSPAADFCHRKLDLDTLPAETLTTLVKGMASLRRHITWSQIVYTQSNLDFSARAFRGAVPSCQEVIVDAGNKHKPFLCSAGDILLRLESFKELLAEALDGATVPVAPGRTRSLVCSKCRAQVIADVQVRREIIWNSLPAMFGLAQLLDGKWDKSKAS
ncbi:hypothetical protein PENSPDRAFT_748418 [Peniophora sp. CONT]|nr:hypothetical protein PENSPDRAFT_748418 [Peniophora sp. CONT]